MNAIPESIIVNSCQYTPVYLIQDPGATQGQSYYITQSSLDESKPVSDNLKAFYESSGNIDSTYINVNNNSKPRILKKQDSGVVGNNLKLASFLLPKSEKVNKPIVVNNVVLKPNVTVSNTVNNTVSSTVTSTTPNNILHRLNVDSKIVKLKDVPLKVGRYNRIEKEQPKINKPKELPPILTPAQPKHTSVQLLKLGETYHSLNQLSDEQMKMVSHALQIFSNPEKLVPEPAYDPVTNTKYIYKVVSPRDLTVVGKNNTVKKNKRYESLFEEFHKAETIKEQIAKCCHRREVLSKEDIKKEGFVKEIKKDNLHKNGLKNSLKKVEQKKENMKKSEQKKEIMKKVEHKKDIVKKVEDKLLKQKIRENEEEEELTERSQPQVTRSGRKVKLPKLISQEGKSYKPRKKNTYVTCIHCSDVFPSLYRLQKHYESHPTHIPGKIHSNLFHCLLAIVKGGTDSDQTNIFIQQLEQLIVKLRSLLPCLLKNSEGEAKACTVNDDVGRLLGMEPGKYHLDMEALNCEKDKDGYCHHSPKDIKPDPNIQTWVNVENEDTLNKGALTEDCARINSVEKWPTVNKRVWIQKQQKTEVNAKRMRLASDNCDMLIELGMDDLVILGDPDERLKHSAIINSDGAENKADVAIKTECNDISNSIPTTINIVQSPDAEQPNIVQPQDTEISSSMIEDQRKKSNHAQFHSTHFDIRSSPIKPTSTVFRKFQINPELLAKYETQIIRSIETVDKDDKGKVAVNSDEDTLMSDENVLQTSAEVVRSTAHIMEENPDVLQSDNVLPSRIDVLNTNDDAMQSSDDALQNNSTSNVPLANDDTLQGIFRDEDLSAVKESFILDKELKDWILNRSNFEKSEDGFSRSTSLIESALLHVQNDEIKSLSNSQKVDLPTNDNHDESSVLNFLDTLGNDCLSYPGTEIRTNNGDFQMDLFSFHS